MFIIGVAINTHLINITQVTSIAKEFYIFLDYQHINIS